MLPPIIYALASTTRLAALRLRFVAALCCHANSNVPSVLTLVVIALLSLLRSF